MEIGDLARAAAGPTWSRLEVRRDQVGAYARTVVTCDGREIPVEGMDEPFQLMRELSYEAGAGTWFTCELEFAAGTRAYAGRVQSAEPPFEEVPPVAALAELTAFPRLEPPAWLSSALPTAVPLGLPGDHDDNYHWLYTSDDRPPPPPPPINGEMSYTPDAGMTAGVLLYQQDHGHQTLYLAERADDQECEHFYVGRYDQAYWVARQGMRAAGEAVRALTLDGDRLVVEVTTEGADELETETVFTIRLDLPPERIGTLRTVLPGVLGQVESPPELIGF
ncbi:hypothetical protein GCM10022224_044810 [Nonomuraea antimicrobica]|uniref:Uncharacterized protein n=2 Tax=Nonomuraea antimicrobica TaxID=561173 RepID=A0ABP7C419_9ACTN